eukprot:GEMP01072781.1.p1 GENE.GEMP01072781.1~~GEMP01072781.1.p1  ORF type:complete len:258 (+),score=37.16 GEMP01072781.1:50-775(+)
MARNVMRAFLDPLKNISRQDAGLTIARTEFPNQFPFPDSAFVRLDSRPDGVFYKEPRLVQHIDDAARQALTLWYAANLPKTAKIHLDLCSSWVSHLPEEYTPKRVIGVGMSEEELKENPRLHEHHVRDLNHNPSLEGLNIEKDSVDVCTIACSVDYLVKPREVFEEIKSYLVPGHGIAVMSFSNRCFPPKVVSAWLKCNDAQRMLVVSSYFHFSGFNNIRAVDATKGDGDPLLIVAANRPF